MKPDNVTHDGMESVIREQQQVKRLAPLQLPYGTLNSRFLDPKYLPFIFTLNDRGLK